MDRFIPESTYTEHSESIYQYLVDKGYDELVAQARVGHYSKFYVWYLAAIDSGSPLYEISAISPNRMTLFYNGLYWYQVYLFVQESLDAYSDGDNSLFNEMLSNPPAPPDASVLDELFELAEAAANRHINGASA